MKNDKKITVAFYDLLGDKFEYETLKQLIELLENESKFWKEEKKAFIQSQPDNNSTIINYYNVADTFDRCLNEIKSWSTLDEWDQNTLNQHISNIHRNYLNQLQQSWVYSHNPVTIKFVELCIEANVEKANAFLDYFTQQSSLNLSNRNRLEGALSAYEFALPNSDLSQRADVEKKAIAKLKNRLSDTNESLIKSVNQTKDNFQDWTEIEKKQLSRIGQVSKKWAKSRSNNFNKASQNHIDNWEQKYQDLESTYKEKLRLQGPAEYWSKKAKQLMIQGVGLSLLLSLILVTGFIELSNLFILWLENGEQLINLSSIQGAVIFASLIGVIGFGGRVLSRLIFSSFHLMRDAEEREKLTYLYLSLSNESEVDTSARDIVLQSLFSRSETGLINQESGPTMPAVVELAKSIPKGNVTK